MLSQYQYDVRDLLRDDYGQFYSTPKITRYINRARVQVALITRCIRVLAPGASPSGTDATVGIGTVGGIIPGAIGNANTMIASVFSTIAGQEKYPYSYANPFIQQQNGGVKGVFDVMGVAVSWGGNRPALGWMPWQDFQAYTRGLTYGMTSYPCVYSKYQDGERGQVYMFPTPSVASEMEWDCACAPIDLTDDNTVEALPAPFTNGVKYYAANLAYLNSQQPGMAAKMLELFHEHLLVDNSAVDSGGTPNFYYADSDW